MSAPTFVQAGVDDNGGGGDPTVALTVTTGNTITVFVAFGTGRGDAVVDVSDGVNSYSQVGDYNDLAFNGAAVFSAQNVTGGALSIAAPLVSGTPGGFYAISVCESAAAGGYPSFSAYQGSGQSTGADPIQSGPFTTSSDPSLVFVFESNYYTLSSPSGDVDGTSLTLPAGGQLNNGTGGAGNIITGYMTAPSQLVGKVASVVPGGTVYGVMFVVAYTSAVAPSGVIATVSGVAKASIATVDGSAAVAKINGLDF